MVTTRRSMGGRKKCLVTGGAGFLGQHLVQQLVDSGKYEVTVFDIRDSGNESVQTVVGDLRNLKQVEGAVAGMAISFIFTLQILMAALLQGSISGSLQFLCAVEVSVYAVGLAYCTELAHPNIGPGIVP